MRQAGTQVPVFYCAAIPQKYLEKKAFLRLRRVIKSVIVAALSQRADARFVFF